VVTLIPYQRPELCVRRVCARRRFAVERMMRCGLKAVSVIAIASRSLL
jgi:hypothetical protein